jgi:hypothetical protein
MGGKYTSDSRIDKYAQDFGLETWREEANLGT